MRLLNVFIFLFTALVLVKTIHDNPPFSLLDIFVSSPEFSVSHGRVFLLFIFDTGTGLMAIA
ncbi:MULTISPECIES: hypothetical protein [Citrobacter]|uniref:hypothetical protein n=1 Tax=Citrobacter TaxID=544 RepID=UPI00214D3D62|nr:MULTISPECIES: hypothetical protein [Citrobacter]MCR3694424.1 hypothetical protein [Citrobacter portucalensis]MDM2903357.1 hypothetical protein [Citrobacter sp. Cpo037]